MINMSTMVYFVNYSPYLTSLSNDQNARTTRVGVDDPQPIKFSVYNYNEMFFQFQDENNVHVEISNQIANGKIMAKIFNYKGVKLLEKNLRLYPGETKVALLSLDRQESQLIGKGLFHMDITIEENGQEEVVQTKRGRSSGFIIEGIGPLNNS